MEPSDRCQLDAAGVVEFAAGLACNEIEEVGQELVQGWVEEPDGDGEAVHGLEDRLEVGDLGFLQLAEGGSLGRSIAAEDEPAHDRQPVGGEEHVLGAAESDALRSEFAGERRIVGGVGVGPDLDVPSGHVVGPGEQRVEFRWRHRSERVQCPEIDAAGAAIDGDDIARFEHGVADGDGRAGEVHVRCADHSRDAPTPSDDRGMADQAAPVRHDALGGLHAHDVVGRRLGSHEDDVLTRCCGFDRRVGTQHDPATRRAG